jgi:hypothetical protein
MFFSVFWTVYIPVTILMLSLLWQSLLDFVHRKHAHVRLARSNRRSTDATDRSSTPLLRATAT